jgi:hypothetical protein
MFLRRLKYPFALTLYGFPSANTAWDSHLSDEMSGLCFSDQLTAADTQLMTGWFSSPKSTGDFTFLRMKSYHPFSCPHWVEAPAFSKNTVSSFRTLGRSATVDNSFFFHSYWATYAVSSSSLFGETVLSLNNEVPGQMCTDDLILKKVY